MSSDTTDSAMAENADAKSADQSEESIFTQLQGDLERFRDLALRTQPDL